MIQRYLYEIIKDGIDAITADPTLLDDLFDRDLDIEDDEVTGIKEYFVANPPGVVNGYARQEMAFPLYSIILGREGEAENFLGEDGGQLLDEDDEYFAADIETAIWEHNYLIYVYAENPDVTAYYYEILKTIIQAQLSTLVDYHCHDFKMTGMDLAPDPQYIPSHLFVRQLSFTCRREFQRIDRDSRFGKAFTVEGIHIDDGAELSDVGVKLQVTPYTDSD